MAFRYTLLMQDGRKSLPMHTSKELEFSEMYKMLECQTIEMIPRDYYPEGTPESAVIWGDEEGRFNNRNYRNPHMKVLHDNRGGEWDCVGDLLLQEEIEDA